jgi:tRNA(fMet)-specific endonuclease VapC
VSASIQATGNGVLLDTNIVVNHFRATNSALKSHLQAGGIVYLPLTVFGELLAGACRVVRREKALHQINTFLLLTSLLLPDETTAINYGEIHAELAQAGTPIPQNDLWIAAQAREHQLPIATCDAHFAQVRGLTVLDWR